MIHIPTATPDLFHSGAMITDPNRKIIYANQYFTTELHWPVDKVVGINSDDVFTPSSKIFCESYLMPLLIHEGICEEIQLAMLDGKGQRVSILVNARMDVNGNIYWSFFNASKRDKLYEEVIQARKELEKQAQILKSMSATDELTGLVNRRELSKQAARLISQAKRYKQPLSVLLMDIDFFKKINDNFGHLEGDRVLAELGQALLQFSRRSDLIARYGGEEFVLILPKTDASQAALIAQKVHTLISQIKVNEAPITISIGVTISDGNQTLEVLVNEADNALYQAKNAGRNRTVFYQAEQPNDYPRLKPIG